MRNQHRPSASALLAAIGLVIACAGGGYAAAKIDTKQLAAKAVTKPKLAPSERSEGFVTDVRGQIQLPTGVMTRVAALRLPKGGKYVVSAKATLGNSQAMDNFVECTLRDRSTILTRGSEALPPFAAFSATITLLGTSEGGVVRLHCNTSVDAVARDRLIIATRVGTLRAK